MGARRDFCDFIQRTHYHSKGRVSTLQQEFWFFRNFLHFFYFYFLFIPPVYKIFNIIIKCRKSETCQMNWNKTHCDALIFGVPTRLSKNAQKSQRKVARWIDCNGSWKGSARTRSSTVTL
jgi:hypothetical protein